MCRLPEGSWSWNSPVHSSTVSQWALQCASPIVHGLPALSFFLSCLINCPAPSMLADSSLGQKNMLALSCLIMSVFGCLTVFSVNVWIYAGLLFVSGLGRAVIVSCSFVLGSKLIGQKWRGKVGIFGFVCYDLNFLLPAFGLFAKESLMESNVHLYLCPPYVVYSIIVYFSAHESLRWLYIKGKKWVFTVE
ncbi:organic cation transporter-related family protein [Striga asiatica]|uniref:Organic cation transporter-related family protein n=1 Tax=Striga asiatica TaxID=4170 RepID=A0A5A7QNY7_STRAF|nr:organic cation transporter-related family protein [Striga asiatica]